MFYSLALWCKGNSRLQTPHDFGTHSPWDPARWVCGQCANRFGNMRLYIQSCFLIVGCVITLSTWLEIWEDVLVSAYRSEHFPFASGLASPTRILLRAARIRSPCVSLFPSGRLCNFAHTTSCHPHSEVWGFRTWALNPDCLSSNPSSTI